MWLLLTLPSFLITSFLLYGLYKSQSLSSADFFNFHNISVPSNESMPLYPNQVEFNFTEMQADLEERLRVG
jgi:hypothetical protein